MWMVGVLFISQKSMNILPPVAMPLVASLNQATHWKQTSKAANPKEHNFNMLLISPESTVAGTEGPVSSCIVFFLCPWLGRTYISWTSWWDILPVPSKSTDYEQDSIASGRRRKYVRVGRSLRNNLDPAFVQELDRQCRCTWTHSIERHSDCAAEAHSEAPGKTDTL